MSETTQTPVERPGFFVAIGRALRPLFLGPDNTPDEAATVYIVANLILWIGTGYNTWHDHHFPLLDFATAESGLTGIYVAAVTARSRWRTPP